MAAAVVVVVVVIRKYWMLCMYLMVFSLGSISVPGGPVPGPNALSLSLSATNDYGR